MSSLGRDFADAECFCFQLAVSPHLYVKNRKVIMLSSGASFTCLPHLTDIKKQHLTD